MSTLERKIGTALGRIFRHFLWDGVHMVVNDSVVTPVDPLYLKSPSRVLGGAIFQEPTDLMIRTPPTGGELGRRGQVTITFSELPVREWHDLPNDEKRRRGLSNGAGVSVVRAGREVDYGWFFMGSKRRENYDDWWRCEVRFEPELDEAFGITHSKQQIRPAPYLLEALVPVLEATARALNGRARKEHQRVKTSVTSSAAETHAAAREVALEPLPVRRRLPPGHAEEIARLTHRHPTLGEAPLGGDRVSEYKFIEDTLDDGAFFRPVRDKGRLTIVINPRHAFYQKMYVPAQEAGPEALALIQLGLLAAARAEVSATAQGARAVAAFRKEWGRVLGVYMGKGR